MNKPFKNPDSGVIMYPELPANMRAAKREDFIDSRGVELVDVPFLAKSFHYDRYELHRSKPGTIDKWQIWLEENQLFVSNK